ncbi:MAG: AAA family ATPase [Deltaproteobacteria bacterium]|nr:AAA family ATPase [Deltaproteobacteria bacterium]
MIRSLHIEGFGPLKDVTVELEPFTVLVGPNDAGKSMLLRALATLAEAGAHPEGWRGPFRPPHSLELVSFERQAAPVRWHVRGEAHGGVPFEYEAALTQGDRLLHQERVTCGEATIVRDPPAIAFGVVSGGPLEQERFGGPELPLHHAHWLARSAQQTPEFRRFQEILGCVRPALSIISGIRTYAPRAEALRLGYVPPDDPQTDTTPVEPIALEPSGRGLPDALVALMLRRREVLQEIEERLRRAMPEVQRVDVEQLRPKGGTVRNVLEIVTKRGTRVPAAMVSDGVLLYLGYLYLALGPSRHSLLLLEEPDHGLHPGRLEEVVKLLRGLTEPNADGTATQVVVVTHSPILLDFLRPEEIRTVTRAQGATEVARFSEISDLPRLLEYLGPGEIWTNFGKDFSGAGDELDH